MDIKKIKDMIWNFIFMSSEFGDDICWYFKVIFGKIKKKIGESKEKIENCVYKIKYLLENNKNEWLFIKL